MEMLTSNKCIELLLMISVWLSWSCSLSLFDLPVEIIERIADNIEPLELRQMVCSCKTAHAWYRKDAILPSLIKYYERSVPLIELKWKIKNSAKARRQFLQDKTIHAKWHLRYFFLVINQNILDRSTHVKEILEYSILPKLIDNPEEFKGLVDNTDDAVQEIVSSIKDSIKMDMLKSIVKANSATLFNIFADKFAFPEVNLIEYILKYDAENILFLIYDEIFANRFIIDALDFHEQGIETGKYDEIKFPRDYICKFEYNNGGIPSLSDIKRVKAILDRKNIPLEDIEIVEGKDYKFVQSMCYNILLPQYALLYNSFGIFSLCLVNVWDDHKYKICLKRPTFMKSLLGKGYNEFFSTEDRKDEIEDFIFDSQMFCHLNLNHKESFHHIASFYLKYYLIDVFLDLTTIKFKHEAYFTIWKHVFRLPEFNVALEKRRFCMNKTIKSLINTAEHIIARSDRELASIRNVASKLREIYRKLKTDPLNERNNCSKFIKETDEVNKESSVSKCAAICEKGDNRMESIIEDKNNHQDDCDIDTLETETRIDK
ncbi:hypothetical protein ROZALSC1DRAFT_24631, partial [Rozella allomycis CSF55]